MSEKQQGATISFGTDGGTYKATNIGEYNEPLPVLDDLEQSRGDKKHAKKKDDLEKMMDRG